MSYQEYPRWVKVDGPGHPQHPGHVLVESEDQEREALASGTGPAELNPEPEPKPEGDAKPIEELTREELIAEIVKESITDDVSDDQLRHTLKGMRGQLHDDYDDTGGNEHESRTDQLGDIPGTDAAGDAIPPDPADEANKGSEADATRTAPPAAAAPETDARPEDAKAKEADDHPATDQVDAALTPPDQHKPRRRAHAAPKDGDKK